MNKLRFIYCLCLRELLVEPSLPSKAQPSCRLSARQVITVTATSRLRPDRFLLSLWLRLTICASKPFPSRPHDKRHWSHTDHADPDDPDDPGILWFPCLVWTPCTGLYWAVWTHIQMFYFIWWLQPYDKFCEAPVFTAVFHVGIIQSQKRSSFQKRKRWPHASTFCKCRGISCWYT